jgi:hypothetical protein
MRKTRTTRKGGTRSQISRTPNGSPWAHGSTAPPGNVARKGDRRCPRARLRLSIPFGGSGSACQHEVCGSLPSGARRAKRWTHAVAARPSVSGPRRSCRLWRAFAGRLGQSSRPRQPRGACLGQRYFRRPGRAERVAEAPRRKLLRLGEAPSRSAPPRFPCRLGLSAETTARQAKAEGRSRTAQSETQPCETDGEPRATAVGTGSRCSLVDRRAGRFLDPDRERPGTRRFGCPSSRSAGRASPRRPTLARRLQAGLGRFGPCAPDRRRGRDAARIATRPARDSSAVAG